MLIDKINTCTSSIHELSTLRSDAVSLKAYEISVNKLAGVQTLVTDFASTVAEMNKHDFCRVNLSQEELGEMLDAITTCAAAVNNMALNKENIDNITAVFQRYKRLLAQIWQSEAKAHVAPIRSYLGIIQIFAPNKGEIVALIQSLHTGSTIEPSEHIVRTLVDNANKANAITGNFQMSESVRLFLQKVKNNTATYADITDDVAKWIKDHKLDSRIKLTFID